MHAVIKKKDPSQSMRTEASVMVDMIKEGRLE